MSILRVDHVTSAGAAEDAQRLADACAVLAGAFPDYADRIAALPRQLHAAHEREFGILLLTLEDARLRPRAVALVHHHADLGYAFLDIIATAPGQRGGGYGGALYQALRERLSAMGVRGLFMDVPPDEPHMVADPEALSANRARLRFYERFGARPIIGSVWEGPPPLGQTYDPPFLVFDGLDRDQPLARADAAAMARAILIRRYDWEADHPYVEAVAASFTDDPVRLRPPRYRARPRKAEGVRPFAVVASDEHRIHHVRERGYIERPARVSAVLAGLEGLPITHLAPQTCDEALITAVHTPDFVEYLRTICMGLPETETVYPYVFPVRRPDRKPNALWLRAGYYCIDTFTPLSRNAWLAARRAVDCAVTAADRLLADEPLAYALCRPPGHHAEPALFGGFCYLNNAAIAARHLTQRGPVAMLDIDFHHGNGAQSIFWTDPTVLTVSIHGHPNEAYPYFSGFDDEVGEGAGEGCNLNLPLPAGTDDAAWLAALERALSRIADHRPWAVVLGLGFDLMRGDPTGDFNVSPEAMGRIGEAIGGLGVPVLVVQEGGYALPNLRRGAFEIFRGLGQKLARL
ncbi:MAG: histone deacetylase family protein [Deltaproteobacteria bacterium]|nr:histone deacetylase family protein [Deltaproteobacteria bacterium]MCB9787199.1 histone deacetylase family protein [Deltaproteobacteria bacterium]